MDKIAGVVKQLSLQLQQHNYKLVTAESCTGGWVAKVLTSVAGSSSWFERGLVTYSNLSKQELLGVKSSTLTKFGAVSREVVIEMAQGALDHSPADVSLAITGIAGPSSDSKDKPIGTVYFAWASPIFDIQVIHKAFSGGRDVIREKSVLFSLQHLLQLLTK